MGIRTPDLLNAIEALYQLSYDPVFSRTGEIYDETGSIAGTPKSIP
jgi:hypothetical protein